MSNSTPLARTPASVAVGSRSTSLALLPRQPARGGHGDPSSVVGSGATNVALAIAEATVSEVIRAIVSPISTGSSDNSAVQRSLVKPINTVYILRVDELDIRGGSELDRLGYGDAHDFRVHPIVRHEVTTRDSPRRPLSVQQCRVASTDVLERLEAAFTKRRSAMLATDAGRWALFVQPTDGRRRPEFVGCFDDEHQACAAGFGSSIGRRFLVKPVLTEDPVLSIPWAVPADQF